MGLSSGPRAAATGPGSQSTRTVSPCPWWDGNLYLGHVLVLITHPKEQRDQAPVHRPLHSPLVAPEHSLPHVSVETDGGHLHGARLLGWRRRILARGEWTAITLPPWHAAPADLHLPAPCTGTRPGLALLRRWRRCGGPEANCREWMLGTGLSEGPQLFPCPEGAPGGARRGEGPMRVLPTQRWQCRVPQGGLCLPQQPHLH